MSAEVLLNVRDASAFGRVAVMYGGSSSERDVSLVTGAAVLSALREAGVDAVGWDPSENSFRDFIDAGFDRAWIALHGPGGEDGTLQGALEVAGVAYTGSGVLASALAMDKVRSKMLFTEAGLATPAWRNVRDRADLGHALSVTGLPLIVKPSSQGSSVGMQRVEDQSGLLAAWEAAAEYDSDVIIERWIDGDEFTVAVLQGQALPSIRIETPRIFYDYEAKYEAADTVYHCPGSDDPLQEQELARMALAAFDALGCSGWGRVDFMVDGSGIPHVLEVNTVPGMTSHSLVPMAAKAAGIDFQTLCWRILETSLIDLPAVQARRSADGS